LYSLKQSLCWIIASVVVITGPISLIIWYTHNLYRERQKDPSFNVVAIVQKSVDKEEIKTEFLAELMGLSYDKPTNLYRFNAAHAQKMLCDFPPIKEAKVKKIWPGTVFVEYTLKKPIAYLADYSNTAVDERGVIFPVKPFIAPKKLPQVYMGLDLGIEQTDLLLNLETAVRDAKLAQDLELESLCSGAGHSRLVKDRLTAYDSGSRDCVKLASPTAVSRLNEPLWGQSINGKRWALAIDVLETASQMFAGEETSLVYIDVSDAYNFSCGKRQIVLECKEWVQANQSLIRVILRLAPEHYQEQLANYAVLKNYLRQQQKKDDIQVDKTIVVDMRILGLGLMNLSR